MTATASGPSSPFHDLDDYIALRDLRKDNKITAILHTGYPIRHWDKDLGPSEPHLLGVDLADNEPSDLTPAAGSALRDADFDISPDGRFVVTTWQQPASGPLLPVRAPLGVQPAASTHATPRSGTS